MDNFSVRRGKIAAKSDWPPILVARLTASQRYAPSACQLLWKHRNLRFRPLVSYNDPEIFWPVDRSLDSLLCTPVRLCSGFDTNYRMVFRSNRKEESVCDWSTRFRRCVSLAKHDPKPI